MYKLVIVEDEMIVRKNIIRKIEWEKYGFSVAGEAENGKEALDVIDSVNPDLIITDIDMPFMNGLELSKAVREKYPITKIVLLTGFDEFKYAQQAIEFNVTEYALKPISSEDLIKILIKIKAQIDEEVSRKENIEALREHYVKSLPVLKGNFLSSLVTYEQKENDILAKASYYDLDLKGALFLAAAASIDKSSIHEKWNNAEDSQLIHYAVANTVEEIIARHSFGIVFVHEEYVMVIMKEKENNEEYMIEKAFRILEEVRQSIEKYMKLTVTIGMGSLCKNICMITESFKGALSALDYRFMMGNNKLIYIEDLEPEQGTKVMLDESKEHMLVSTIKFGKDEELNEVIEALFAQITDVHASLSEYQIYLLEILAAIIKVTKDLRLDVSAVFGTNYNFFVEMFRFNTIAEVKEWFENICCKLMGLICSRRKSSSKVLVEKAQEYIKENYKDSELSLNKVSSFLHISPNYFGATFKSETGETFVNYLLKIRMEAAKDLICSTNQKNLQIAESVGISDQYYFSYCFKKYFKTSPNEFRNSLNK